MFVLITVMYNCRTQFWLPAHSWKRLCDNAGLDLPEQPWADERYVQCTILFCYTAGRNARLSLVPIASRGIR